MSSVFFFFLAQGSVVVLAATVAALLAVSRALSWRMGVATLVALWEGCEGIPVDGGC